jgi:hypothetical protein
MTLGSWIPSLLTKTSLAAVALFALTSTVVHADDPPATVKVRQASTALNATPVVSPSEITATPEMWFYEQALRRYDDPKNAVRAAAEYKANQRRARLAAMAWYGYSNSRPSSGIDPISGVPLQPGWAGNGYMPNTWVQPTSAATMWIMPGYATGF